MRRRVLADRNMRVLFAGQTANMFGNTALLIVLGIWVKDLTGSSGAAGLIFLLLAGANLLAPAAGLLVDRFPRRPLLMANDAVTGLAVLLLLTVHRRPELWVIYLITGVYGLSGLVYRSARGGLLHSMVPDDLLGDANGLFSTLNQATRILGPLVGAGMYAAWGGGVVVWVDIGTFAISIGSYFALRDVRDFAPAAVGTPGTGQRESFGSELLAGIRHIAANPVIRRMVLSSTAAFAGAGVIDVAMFSLVSQGLHKPAAMIGVLTSIEGAGSMIAGICVGSMMRRAGEYAVACAGFVLNGVGLAVSSVAAMPEVVAGTFLLGLGLPMVLVAELTVVQRRTSTELQGRALSASDAIVGTPFAISIGVGAGVIGAVGYRPMYLGVAAAFVAVGLALLPYLKVTSPRLDAAELITTDDAIAAQGG